MEYVKTTAASRRAATTVRYLHVSVAVKAPVLNDKGQVIEPAARTPKGEGKTMHYNANGIRQRKLRKTRPGAQRRVAIRLAREMGQEVRP